MTNLSLTPGKLHDGPAKPASIRLTISTLALAALAAIVVLCALAAQASATVTEVGGTKVGLQDREVARYWDGEYKFAGLGSKGPKPVPNLGVRSFRNPAGHAVLHSANTYAIYWDPQDYYNPDWQGMIDGFLANLGISGGQLASAFAVDAQYTDSTNQPATDHSVFHGAYTDTNAYPANGCVDPHPFEFFAPLTKVCLTDAQLRAQLQTFIAQHGLIKGMGSIFYILTPPGVAVCLDAGGKTGHCSDFEGTIKEVEVAEENKEETTVRESYERSFCSYHSFIGSGDANTILYGAIPWTAGGAGNYHFAANDETQAYDCQDGGFQPATEAGGEVQEKERKKPKTPIEEEEFKNKNAKEKREQEEAEALGLTGPHEQEPNQRSTRSSDGGYDSALGDMIVNQIAIEQQNTITNPLLNAWQDPAGSEVTDECRNTFVPPISGSPAANPLTEAGTLANAELNSVHYYLGEAFNAAAYRLPYPGIPCLSGVAFEPAFTAPNAVNSGEVVGFDGMESNIALNSTVSYPSGATTYAVYTWNFGDGSPTVSGFAPGAAALNSPNATPCEAPWLSPCAASTYHSYQYGGSYVVTLTAKDVGGNVASVSHVVTVSGPAPPTPEHKESGGGSTTQTTSGGGTSTPAPTPADKGVKPAAGPVVATQAVLSRSLSSVLKSGLTVRYSVNEQVAGRFEVLLASSIARKLGIHGAAATGLAKGTPAQTIIGKAVLVTTKGGRGTYRLKLSSAVSKRLRKLRKVTLMVRLVVHNASNPAPTTVLNSVNLSR